MKKYKMIVTDLDDTILHKDKSISEYTKLVLRQCREKGIKVVAATARYLLAAEEYLQYFDYMISNDGAITYQNGRYLYGKAINQKVIDWIIGNARKEVVFVTKENVYHNVKELKKTDPLNKGVYVDKFTGFQKNVFKVITQKENLNDYIRKISKECGCRIIEYRDGDWASIVNNDVNKFNAVLELGDYLGVEMRQVVAFGDDNNDLEMIKQCGLGVVVENGMESVKNITNAITQCNDADGVAKYIKNKILGDEI